MGSSKVLRFAQADTGLCTHMGILFSLLFIWHSCCAEAQAVLQKALLRDNCQDGKHLWEGVHAWEEGLHRR